MKKNNVRYLIIGGIAAVYHGVPRVIYGLDITIDKTYINANNLLNAFIEAGLGTAALITPEELLEKNITVFKDLIRIDVHIDTPGINFEDSWNKKEIINYGGQSGYMLSKDCLIAAKLASARKIDLEDVKLLKQN